MEDKDGSLQMALLSCFVFPSPHSTKSELYEYFNSLLRHEPIINVLLQISIFIFRFKPDMGVVETTKVCFFTFSFF